LDLDPKHRGFGFVTFSSTADALDAIDNMDMNELKGKVLKVNLARPAAAVVLNPQSNKASASSIFFIYFVPCKASLIWYNFNSLGIRRVVEGACETTGTGRWCAESVCKPQLNSGRT